jgi:hypothetical protein
MKQDRFLIGILIIIAILVVISLVLFFIRKDNLTYLADNSPEAVVHNYALAVHQGDYQKAYTYLADKEHKPTYEQFRQAFLTHQINVSQNSLRVGQADINGDEAIVQVTVSYSSGDPFSRGWSSNETAVLVRQNGRWLLSQMPYNYWGWEWYQPTPEPMKE